MSVIKLKNINKLYGKKNILNNFSIEVEENEFLAITGPSGCGKSTLLNIIGLLEPFNSGELIIDGYKNIPPNSKTANKILREKISYLFQNYALIDEETVAYNLALALKYNKQNKNNKTAISDALDRVGLNGYEHKKIYTLSGGEQQRVSIARILLKPSKIILADEPTGSLDDRNRDIVIDLLKELHLMNKTIIIVTHDNYVSNKCQNVISLS